VQRYRDRSGRKVNSEKEAAGMLRAAALYGKRIANRAGNAYEIKYQGLHIVAVYNGDALITVVTCLGCARYRHWSYKNEVMPKYQRRKAN
jgi:hypothetical protein